jgi:serine/threonine protein kinase/Tol biopolymer transport system component
MQLAAGDRLGDYEIVAPIGAGGMGEVYRARDTRLGREVAIKVLPEALAHHPDRLARFEREARVLAALNHPNIAIIHGLAESESNAHGIVMELVEGPTLAERLKDGPLPLEEALAIARQVAEALEAAHEKRVVHRDLKPANIKITTEGTVKVLDFGLATAMQSGDRDSADPVNSPTLTMGATEAGVILGTAAYMSPEQASGKRVDKRADIWSFGVVLWEMLAGRRLFEGGETVSHTLADVLRAPIDLEKVSAPRPIRELLKRCLDRDVKTRLRDIGEARVAIARYLANPESAAEVASNLKPAPRPWDWIAAAAVFTIAAIGVGGWIWLHQPTPDTHSLRYTFEAPPETRFAETAFGAAVSPDGRLLVFAALRPGSNFPSLWLRPMDSLAARELPGTESGNGVFWSPDSKSIGFAAQNQLKRVNVLGGSPQVLCDASRFEGGTWSQDGTILFSANDVIQHVSDAGGAPTPVTTLDASRQETAQRHPYFLPDGKSFLFTIVSANQNTQGIYVASLSAPQQRIRLAASGYKGVYAPPRDGWPGYLLWVRDQTLVAQRFNGKTRLEGEPIPIIDEVGANQIGRAAFWISETGLLLYRAGAGRNTQLHWVAGDGQREAITGAGTGVRRGNPRLSPDATRVAFDQLPSAGTKSTSDVWSYEFARGVMTPLTTGPGNNDFPVWSPDGVAAFSSDRDGTRQIYRKDASGTGQPERLTQGPNPKVPLDWSRDGRYILYQEQDPKTGDDIWALPLEGERKPIPLLKTSSNERQAQFSPDSKWIVYASNESGAYQIYVQSFPPSGRKEQVSNAGGYQPRWQGNQIFYYCCSASGNMWAARIQAKAGQVAIDSPRQLMVFYTRFSDTIHYDVTRDGRRLLEIQPASAGPSPSSDVFTVLSNWQASLRK